MFVPGLCSNANAYLQGFPEAARKQGGVIGIEGDVPCGGNGAFRSFSWDAAKLHARIEKALGVMISCARDVPARMRDASKRLARTGVPSTYVEMPGCTHGNLAEGDRVFDEAFDFLRARHHLGLLEHREERAREEGERVDVVLELRDARAGRGVRLGRRLHRSHPAHSAVLPAAAIAARAGRRTRAAPRDP